jgi:DNA-directed RNA polymerase subunit RPC12/RpoP
MINMAEEEGKPIFVRVGNPQAQRPTIIQPNVDRINQTLSQINNVISSLQQARPRILQQAIFNRLEMLNQKLQALNFQPVQQKQEEKKPETVKCPYCEAEVPLGSKFCPNCGYKLEAERPRYGLRR